MPISAIEYIRQILDEIEDLSSHSQNPQALDPK